MREYVFVCVYVREDAKERYTNVKKGKGKARERSVRERERIKNT